MDPAGLSARDLFTRQLDLIKLAFNSNTVLMGDFNLDYNKRFDVNYQRENLFELFENKLGDLNLLQLVNFDTWSRLVGVVLRSSLLDHIYVNNSRQTTFMAKKGNRKRVGLNAFANRVFVLNGRVPLDWFTMNIDTYKVHCKKEFLSR